MARAAAEVHIAADLRARVDNGTLTVRSRLDLRRHTLPVGASLRQAVLFPWEVRPLLEERGIPFEDVSERSGPALWTLRMAADSLGAQHGWHQGTIATFVTRMTEAARERKLAIRDPFTDLPYVPDTVRDFWDLVMPGDVNSWLETQQVSYRWAPAIEEAFSEPAPSEATVPNFDSRALGTKERNTLLVLIAALCNELEIKPNERGVAGQIERMTEELGCPVRYDTVKKHLDAIPRALQDRSL